MTKALLIIVWLVIGNGKPALTSIAIVVPEAICDDALTMMSRASRETNFADKTMGTCVPFPEE